MGNTWRDEAKKALINLGGEASLKEIYKEVEKTSTKKITRTYQASIREALERNSSDSKVFNGKEDIFYSKGIGSGIWGIREKEITTNRELIRYNKYSRNEVHDIFSPDTKFTPNGGDWGMRGIAKVPNTDKDYVFLVTYGQKQGKHEFDEDIDENGILTWQSQPAQTLRNKQIRDFINHNSHVNNIYLFLRTNNKTKYTYLGLLSYVSHDNQREKPVHFKWQILDWDEEACKRSLEGIKITKAKKINSSNIPEKDIKLILKDSANVGYKKSERRGSTTKEFYSNRNINFEEDDRKNSELGKKGEIAVVKHEKDFLIANGKSNLAKDVHRTAETNGNAERFDVISYELDGTPKYIEVKTTTGAASNDFHISEREVAFSHEHAENYYFYRVYNLNTKTLDADFVIIKGAIDRDTLIPTKYTCKIDIKE